MKKIQLVLGGIFLILLGFLGGYYFSNKINTHKKNINTNISTESNNVTIPEQKEVGQPSDKVATENQNNSMVNDKNNFLVFKKNIPIYEIPFTKENNKNIFYDLNFGSDSNSIGNKEVSVRLNYKSLPVENISFYLLKKPKEDLFYVDRFDFDKKYLSLYSLAEQKFIPQFDPASIKEDLPVGRLPIRQFTNFYNKKYYRIFNIMGLGGPYPYYHFQFEYSKDYFLNVDIKFLSNEEEDILKGRIEPIELINYNQVQAIVSSIDF